MCCRCTYDDYVTLELLLKTSPEDKVMFSVDYPFSTTEMGYNFVRAIEGSKLMDSEQLVAFCHGNADNVKRAGNACTHCEDPGKADVSQRSTGHGVQTEIQTAQPYLLIAPSLSFWRLFFV